MYQKNLMIIMSTFVGGAIVFLYMPYEKKVFLNDCNKNVMNLYKQMKKSPEKLIKKVAKYEKEYLESNNKKRYFWDFVKNLIN